MFEISHIYLLTEHLLKACVIYLSATVIQKVFEPPVTNLWAGLIRALCTLITLNLCNVRGGEIHTHTYSHSHSPSHTEQGCLLNLTAINLPKREPAWFEKQRSDGLPLFLSGLTFLPGIILLRGVLFTYLPYPCLADSETTTFKIPLWMNLLVTLCKKRNQ